LQFVVCKQIKKVMGTYLAPNIQPMQGTYRGEARSVEKEAINC